MYDDTKGEYTFRQWNPKMLEAPWGFSNDPADEKWQNNTWFCIFCIIPWSCTKCCAKKSEETMNLYKDGNITVDKLVSGEDFGNSCKTFWLFFGAFMLSWAGMIASLWLIISYLQWIPFVRLMVYIRLDKAWWMATMCFSAILNVTACLWVYAICYTWWRYAMGIPLIVLAIISTWFTFGSIWNQIYR